ncbi:MAG: hypothetical protein EBR59_09615, partial [Methylococcaceae bacterium]|nr:hypothetical protein [Methylococcaceae bacterium]
LNSNNYFTGTYKADDLKTATSPLGTGGVTTNYIESTAAVTAGIYLQTNKNGQAFEVKPLGLYDATTNKSGWKPLTEAGFQTALAAGWVGPGFFPNTYIKRELLPIPGATGTVTNTALFRGFDTWGAELVEGGGTTGLIPFTVTSPVLNPNSCFKGIKILTAVLSMCTTETAANDTDKKGDKSSANRYDVWAGFTTQGKIAIASTVSSPVLVNGQPATTATKVFTNQDLMPNAATVKNTDDGTDSIYWSTITVNRVSPVPASCSTDPNNGLYLGIAPSAEDIDALLPMQSKTKRFPKLEGAKYDPHL